MVTNQDRETVQRHAERLRYFGITSAVIAGGALSWLARGSVFADASFEMRFALLLLYLVMPWLLIGVFGFIRGRAREQWVVNMCIAALYSYVILWVATEFIPDLLTWSVVLQEGFTKESALFLGAVVLLVLVVLGSLAGFWGRALMAMPKRE